MAGTRETGGFTGIGNDGNAYQVIEYTQFTDHRPIQSRDVQELRRSKSYKLPNGDWVNPPSGKEIAWVVFETGVRTTPD
jgi:hypothetical protein